MASKEYQLVPEECIYKDEVPHYSPKHQQFLNSASILPKVLFIALVISLSGNCLWAIQRIRAPPSHSCSSRTKYGSVLFEFVRYSLSFIDIRQRVSSATSRLPGLMIMTSPATTGLLGIMLGRLWTQTLVSLPSAIML